MRRAAVLGAAVVAVVLLVAELAAVPIATRLVGNALGRCLPYEQVEIADVDRPVIPRLAVGRATGVEMRASGLELAGLRVEDAQVHVPLVILPWAVGSPTPREASLELVLLEADLERFLAEELPVGLFPAISLSPGVAELGLDPFPTRIEVAVTVDDRLVEIGPAGPAPDWWERVPIPERFLLPEDLSLTELDVGQGEAAVTLVVDQLAGIDGAEDCAGPLAN